MPRYPKTRMRSFGSVIPVKKQPSPNPKVFDDSYLQKNMDVLEPKIFQSFVFNDLVDREAVNRAFLEDLAFASRIIVRCITAAGDEGSYVILAKCCPITVAYDVDGTLSGNHHELYHATDWTKVNIVYVQNDPSGDSTLAMATYVQSTYYTKNYLWRTIPFNTNAGAYGVVYLSSPVHYQKTIAEIMCYLRPFFDVYSPQIQKAKPSGALQQLNGIDTSTWSETNWPELKGFKTIYIDNVGIFAPWFMGIDYALTYILPANYWVACYLQAYPSEKGQEQQIAWGWVQSVIGLLTNTGAGFDGPSGYQGSSGGYDPNTGSYTSPSGQGQYMGGGAAIAQAIGNTINFVAGSVQRFISNIRLIIPRVRAFGRQTSTSVPPYSTYLQMFPAGLLKKIPIQKSESIKNPDKLLEYVDMNGKNILKMPESAYNAFIQTILPYVRSMYSNTRIDR